MKNRELIIVALGFFDLFGVSMLVTCIPSHVKSFNTSGLQLGTFVSLYGAIQLFSSSIMGHLADRYGRRRLLSICTFASAVGYAALAAAPTFQLLLAARVITGIFKHSQTLSRAILSSSGDRTSLDNIRGYFSAVSSLGFIFGAPIGGWLYDNYGFRSVGFVCSASFFLIWLVTLCTRDAKEEEEEKRRGSDKASFDRNIFLRLWDVYALQFMLATGVMLYRTNFSVAMKARFDAAVSTTGFISSSGAVMGFLGGLVVGRVTSLYSRRYERLLIHVSVMQTACILGCAVTSSLSAFVVIQMPLSFFNALARECIVGVILNRGLKDIPYGKIFGISQSMFSFSRLGTPFLGSVLQEWDIRASAVAGGLCSFVATVLSVLLIAPKAHVE